MTLEELEKSPTPTVTIQIASKIMGVSQRFLQFGIIQGKFPFGECVKMKQNEFYISKEKFIKYMKTA
jgi:hypothetical protein